MLQRSLALLLSVATLLLGGAPVSSAPQKPKLLVAIIIDQFRYDYLTRFQHDYRGGLRQLMTEGANFTNGFYAQVPTVTAIGHSIFMSGAMPAVSGIVGNAWYDRGEKKVVTSVCDWKERVVGGASGEMEGTKCTDADPASPRRLTVSTIGDELMVASPQSKVVGLSIKARGAILPSGHRAIGAYWFDDDTGHFVTSSYYTDSLPEWAAHFNNQKLAAKYVDQKWPSFPGWDFHAPKGSKEPYAKIPASPWGNELIESFAEAALAGENLGTRGVTDMLTVSFSSNDYVGHRVGPDSAEVRDMAIRADALLAKLFRRIDQQVGLKNTVVVLSADHGVSSSPAESTHARMPGGYLSGSAIETTVDEALSKRFGKAEWIIPNGSETSLSLNYDALAKAKTQDGKLATWAEVFAAARHAILMSPELHVTRVYSRDQLDNGMEGDFITHAVMNGYYPRRSADLFLIFEPNFMAGKSGTGHSSPYSYDSHVPILFMGPGIRAGRYHGRIVPNDIAPTLATTLNLQTPSGSSGRVLTEMLIP